MNIKSALKAVKFNESTISMILGAIVIVVVGVLLINYFGGREKGTTIPPVDIEDAQALPAKHVVKADRDIRPKDEVIVVDEEGGVLAVGHAILSGDEMTVFRRGVAVKVRHGKKKVKYKI